MYPANDRTPVAALMSEEERGKVREQLNRLLETHHFKNSRRYPALLRFIVEETLEGRGDYLKERLLGVRVFDRPADYDTATDPVVRVTIAEIRKRIAQYYHDEEHDAELRIELLPGRYAPEFRLRSTKPESAGVGPGSAELELPAGLLPPARFHLRWYWPWMAAAAVLFLSAAVVLGMRWLRPSALDELWGPLLEANKPALFCIPTGAGRDSMLLGQGGAKKATGAVAPVQRATVQRATAGGPTFLAFESLGENVVYSDMLATLNIAGVFTSHHCEYRVRLNGSTNLQDLRQGPVVLVGGMDNQWTMRTLAPLRFHFAGSDQERYWIADSQNPANKEWSLDLKQLYGAVTNDFAIVARIHDEKTGQPEMIVAGIGMSGTASAGEFVADRNAVEELRRRVGPGFKNRNFEAVLSTDVVNGIGGSSKIIAVTVW